MSPKRQRKQQSQAQVIFRQHRSDLCSHLTGFVDAQASRNLKQRRIAEAQGLSHTVASRNMSHKLTLLGADKAEGWDSNRILAVV